MTVVQVYPPQRTAGQRLRTTAGRVPPHDLEAEAAVIASILTKPSRLDEVSGTLKGEHFYNPANERIYNAMLAIAAEGRPIDAIQVSAWLRDRETLAEVGGPAYIGKIQDETPAAVNVAHHARIVELKARRRAIIAESQTIAAEGYGDVGDEVEWIGAAEARLARIAEGTAGRPAVTMRDTLVTVYSNVVAELEGRIVREGGTTGLTDLDDLLGPLQAGRVTALGGFWGDGKSALGLGVALATARQPSTASLVISLEMGAEELTQRALFMDARVNSAKARRRKGETTQDALTRITQHEWQSLADAGGRLRSLSLYIDDREDLTAADIASTVRRHRALAARSGLTLRLVVVDYIQLIDGRAGLGKQANREQEIAAVARALKRVARGQNVHILALGQLNDDAAKRGKDKRPSSKDFRESKAIPMNADNVLLIHNPAARDRALTYHNGGTPAASAGDVVDLIVDKHRGGPTGTVQAQFIPSLTLFSDLPPPALSRHEGTH